MPVRWARIVRDVTVVVSRKSRQLRHGLSRVGVGGELAEEVEDAGGAVDDDVGHLAEGVLLAGGGADEEGGEAAAAQVEDRLERLEVAEVVAAEQEPAGLE